MKYVRVYLAIVGITILAALWAYFWIPNYRYYLLHEDSLIENLTAVLFLISFFIGFLFSIIGKIHRKGLIIVSAISLLGFLDEISFGERLFKLHMPEIDGVKIDAAHDFFELAYRTISRLSAAYSTYAILLLLICIIIVTVLLLRYKSILTKTITSTFRKPQYIMALFFTTFICFSLVIDLDFLYNEVWYVFEELFEMNAALALLVCSLSLREQQLSNGNQPVKSYQREVE
jgi:hypothetical protein